MTTNQRSPKPAFTAQPDPQQTAKRSVSIYENHVALWWQRHRQSFINSLQKFKRAPLATILTVSVIGISLALPALLMVFIKNAQVISAGWGDSTQISLFVKMNVPEQNIQQLINRLQTNPEIASINYISANQGLQEFQAASGFSNLQNALPSNPLPAVIEIKPAPALQTTEAVQQLVNELQQLPEADVVQLDMQWVNRLFAMLEFAKRVVLGLAMLLGLGVVLIIGNTIRLATQNNKEEIEIMKLIGATNAFVRRPFLYTGIFYGVAGGLVAWVLVEIVFWSLTGPIYHLAQAYQTNIQLHGLGFGGSLLLWFLAGLLGLTGSWLVVTRYLNVTRVE